MLTELLQATSAFLTTTGPIMADITNRSIVGVSTPSTSLFHKMISSVMVLSCFVGTPSSTTKLLSFTACFNAPTYRFISFHLFLARCGPPIIVLITNRISSRLGSSTPEPAYPCWGIEVPFPLSCMVCTNCCTNSRIDYMELLIQLWSWTQLLAVQMLSSQPN